MPGVYRYTLDKIDIVMEQVKKFNIPMVAIFPYTPSNKKNNIGSEALNEDNLVCRAIRKIKKKYKNTGFMCDVALDPYTSHGMNGLLKNNRFH